MKLEEGDVLKINPTQNNSIITLTYLEQLVTIFETDFRSDTFLIDVSDEDTIG